MALSPTGSPEIACIRVHLFGSLALWWDELPVDTDTWQGKVQALFVLLATGPERRRSRDEIIDALWPDASPHSGAGNLRMLVHRLRRAFGSMGPLPVLTTPQWIALNPSFRWLIDLEAFDEVVATVGGDPESLEQALQRYAGEVLPAYRYEDWASAIRERAHRQYQKMCLRLAVMYRERGQYEKAGRWCEFLLARDRLDEAALQELLQVWRQLGRRVEAVYRYRAFERDLDEELGVAPDRETVALVEQIRQDLQHEPTALEVQFVRRHVMPIVPSYPLPCTGTLVGRAAELEGVMSALPLGQTDGPRLLLVVGEAGIGKTRLLAEIAQRARQKGMLTLAGGSYDGEGRLPYAPFHDALLDYVRIQPITLLRTQLAEHLRGLLTIVPELQTRAALDFPDAPGSQQADLRLHLFSTVAQVLAAIAVDLPLVLLLDDLQWADDGTLELLHFLTRYPYMDRLLIVGACRQEEIHQLSPLGRLVRQDSETGSTRTLGLGAVRPAQVAHLLTDRLGSPCAPMLVENIERRSSGNPFFALEILRLLQQEGRIEATDAGWNLVPGTTITIPRAVQTVIARRLHLLSKEARKALSLSAVLGREFRYPPLEVMWEGEDHDLFEALDLAREAHVVDEIEDGYAFRHPLLHEVIYNRIPTPLRKRLHREAGIALEHVYGERAPLQAVELLPHFVQGEDAERTLHYALAASRQAAAVHAYMEVETYSRMALDLAHAWGESMQAGEAMEYLGTGLYHLSRYTESLATLTEARTLYAELGTLESERRATAHAGWVYLATGAAQEGIDTIQRALEPVGFDQVSPALFSLYEVLATLLERVGRTWEALEAAERALELARTLDDPALVVRAQGRCGFILNSVGRPEEALSVLETVVTLADSLSDLDTLRRALNNVAHIYSGLGEPEKARRYYERAVPVAKRSGNRAAVAQATIVLGREAVHRGDWTQARQYCEAGIAIAEAASDVAIVLDGHWWLAEYELLTGQPEAVLARLEPWLKYTDLRADLHFDLLLPLARAHLELGNSALANSLIREAMDWVRREGDPIDLRDGLVVQGVVATRQDNWEEVVATFEEALTLSRSLPHLKHGKFRTLGEASALQEYGLACVRTGDIDKARQLLHEALVIFCHLGARAYASATEESLARIYQE